MNATSTRRESRLSRVTDQLFRVTVVDRNSRRETTLREPEARGYLDSFFALAAVQAGSIEIAALPIAATEGGVN
jgi:hypothetical protein